MSVTNIPTSQGAFAEAPLMSNEKIKPTLTIAVATDTTPGIVQPDGSSITIDPAGVISAGAPSGVVTDVTGLEPIFSTGGTTPEISVAVATDADVGVVRPDGETIVVDVDGVISVDPTGGGRQLNIGGIVLTGVRTFTLRGSLLPIGTNDLATTGGINTVPVGKRWAVLSLQAYNTGAVGTVNVALALKSVAAAYYQLQTVVAVNAASALTSNTAISIILEAGEGIAAVVTTTANQLNTNVAVIEFDATCRLFSPRKLGVVTGANTIYTVPPGFSATMLSNTRGQTNCDMRFSADTGGTRTVQVHFVPNGGSVGAATQIAVSSTTAGVTSSYSLGVGAEPGDFVNLSVSLGAATQIAWLNAVAEIAL